MKSKRWVLLFILILMACTPTADVMINTAEIEVVGNSRYQAIRLTPPIYNVASADLSDILLRDREGVIVPYFIYTSDQDQFIETIYPEFNVEVNDQRTKVTIAGLKNLRLHDITIETDSMFKRTVVVPGQRVELYNLIFDHREQRQTTITLQGQAPQGETYGITILDGDDQPININSIIVRYYAHHVIFEGRAGEIYTMEFGAHLGRVAPVYDIARYQADILKAEIDLAQINEINVVTETITPLRDYRGLYNGTIIVVTLILTAVIVLKLKQKK